MWGGRNDEEYMRFLGTEGLGPVLCIRIQQSGATKIAVEKLMPTGTWRIFTNQGVTEDQWSTVMVPGETDFCRTDHHVQAGECIPCPEGTRKPPGDDPFGGDSGCLCKADFHVQARQCVPCPSKERNEAGDDTIQGDAVCDFVATRSFE